MKINDENTKRVRLKKNFTKRQRLFGELNFDELDKLMYLGYDDRQ